MAGSWENTGEMAHACSVLALLCPVMAVVGDSTMRIVGLNRYRGPCVLNAPFLVLDLIVRGRNVAQTLLSNRFFKTYLGLRCCSNFINIIRIQKVVQIYFPGFHSYHLPVVYSLYL